MPRVGYGSQALALKYLGVEFEHWKTCEWAIKSIQAYKDIHFTNTNVDYSKKRTKEELIDYLNNKGISSNYNEPMSLEQIKRLSEDKLRTIYNNIITTHNLVNIQQTKGVDLNIKDTDKYCYIMTYSFPCQDLSNAGLKKGFNDTSTRSGMLWEVERLLDECKELGNLPQVLLMENVIQVHSEGENTKNFNKWQLKLEQLGYKNYWEDLIATDYGIPQTRNRTFMISILGNYNYNFPNKIPLEIKLKDMLEDNVDEKYYLSNKMLNCFLNPSESGKKFGRTQQFLNNLNKDCGATITTLAGQRATDNYICDSDLKKQLCNELIKNNLVEEYDIIKHSYTQQILDGNKKCVEKSDGVMITLTTRGDCVGVCVKDTENKMIGTYQYSKSDNFMKGKDRLQIDKEVADTLLTSPKEGIAYSDLRIRKLTPYECFSLMGVKKEDYLKCAKNQSDASLYHLAGDSIVVNVLMAIFGQLL